MYVCMYACMYVCMYVCLHYVCMYVCMRVCMHVCMHVRTYVCMYACMHVCMYARIYVTHMYSIYLRPASLEHRKSLRWRMHTCAMFTGDMTVELKSEMSRATPPPIPSPRGVIYQPEIGFLPPLPPMFDPVFHVPQAPVASPIVPFPVVSTYVHVNMHMHM